jgi:hypothetical protein
MTPSESQALDCCEPSQLSLRTESACQSPLPTRFSVLARRRLWSAVRITALPAHGVRLHALPTRPSPNKPHLKFQISNLKSPHRAAGSGLLSELQHSPRAEHACQPSPNPPTSEQASRRLWTAGSITALPACGARLQALSQQAPLPTRPPSPFPPLTSHLSPHASAAAARRSRRAQAPRKCWRVQGPRWARKRG